MIDVMSTLQAVNIAPFNRPSFFLAAVYKNDNHPVSIDMNDLTILRENDPMCLGNYRVRCVFSRRVTYTTEARLIQVINDFCAGLISNMEFVIYGRPFSYRVVTSPDVKITSEEIIISCRCCRVSSCLPYSFNKVESTSPSLPNIIEVIFNNPATIVYWSDGTKTVVKACDKDTFDKETGLAMAIAKKTLSYKCQQPRARFKHIVKSAKDYSDNQ